MVVIGPCATEGHCTSERPPIRCKTVLRLACFGLQHTAGFRVTNARARHFAGYLLDGGAARAPATRARCVALVLIGPCTPEGHRTSGMPLPIGAKPWCNMPGAASRIAGFRVTNARARHCAGYHLDGGAARALVTRVRCAGMAAVGPCAIEAHRTSGRPLSIVQDRAPTCRLRPLLHAAGLRLARAGATLSWLSIERRRSTKSCCARVPRRADCGWPVHYRTTLNRRETSPLRCETLVHRANCAPPFVQLPFASALAQALGLALSRERKRST